MVQILTDFDICENLKFSPNSHRFVKICEFGSNSPHFSIDVVFLIKFIKICEFESNSTHFSFDVVLLLKFIHFGSLRLP